MSARRNRPTAFDVSFPTEAGGASTSLNEQSQAGPSNLPSAPARSLSGILNRTINKRTLSDARLLPLGVKRQRTGEPESKPEKAVHPGPKVRYSPDNRDLKEKADLLILGEEEHDGADDKPIRMLSDFSIFDPKHGLELISLSLLDVDDTTADNLRAQDTSLRYSSTRRT
ncbi:hypothetical protein A0H81_11825 [Grifola frondosa]|uniref:Uncharacterized protein n=1 Tax=Grifola frondosa TaxID=5627 RepID=A0A1C7LTV5_GRIFR|nr:hypothetical protein A0H81_11825 [Grifola frondosa]